MANEIARKLRKTMTPQEVKLWAHLRLLKSRGFKFRRQVPLRGYIVDFACFSARLIIELDGSQHGVDEHAERDRVRDEVLERGGFGVLRFWNVEVDRDFDAVWMVISEALRNAELKPRWVEEFGRHAN
ncbi:MAG: endonuclease domain-containing protein [Hyphomonadaceae bacterium]|nr:endonuclease domain-containing protein [Hyphomonadaceae bacterium]